MAKGAVVYLSYTGNTKSIAERICKGMKSVMDSCDLLKLRQADPKKLAGYDLIGIGTPTRLSKEPVEVKEFIENMPAVKGKNAFVFNTHGATPVSTMKNIVTALKDKGLTVIGYADWYCAVYLAYVPKPYFTDGHPDKIDLKEAEKFGKEMAERSLRVYKGEAGLIPDLPQGELYERMYGSQNRGDEMMGGPARQKLLQARAQKFSLDMAKCTRCNVCVEICPSKAIDFSTEPVTFNACDRCWLCEQICPEAAISFNYDFMLEAHNVAVEKMLVPALKIAQEMGRFRPLVKPETVNWDKPLFKTKKAPRFKIA
jgi:flavodoxin/ferredoxin